jgi:putative spermidine/putrescine transport system permease protein
MDTEFTVVVGVIAVNPPFGAALSFVLMTATLLLTVTSNGVAHRRYRR